MGVNQSTQNTAPTTLETTHGITVVNQSPGQELEEEKIYLPAKVSSILSIDGHAIDPTRHGPEVQLNQELWINFVTHIDRYSNSRADLVANRQNHLQEKIAQVDLHVQKFTDSYINDTHKALARMNEDCKQVENVQKLLQKCTTQAELCIDMLNKLNFLLPPDKKLEPLGLE